MNHTAPGQGALGTRLDSLTSYHSGTENEAFLGRLDVSAVCLCICVWTPFVLFGGLEGHFVPQPPAAQGQKLGKLCSGFFRAGTSAPSSLKQDAEREPAALCTEGNASGDPGTDFC